MREKDVSGLTGKRVGDPKHGDGQGGVLLLDIALPRPVIAEFEKVLPNIGRVEPVPEFLDHIRVPLLLALGLLKERKSGSAPKGDNVNVRRWPDLVLVGSRVVGVNQVSDGLGGFGGQVLALDEIPVGQGRHLGRVRRPLPT